MAINSIHNGDSLSVRMVVYTENTTTRKDITGATVTGWATQGRKRKNATGSVEDAANGVALLFFDAGALTDGVWQVHGRVQIGAEVQTLLEDGVVVEPVQT